MADKDPFYSQVKQLGALTTIPIILLIGPVLGFLLGSWADKYFHIYPWLTVIFVCLGFVGSGREVMQLLQKILKDSDKKAPKSK